MQSLPGGKNKRGIKSYKETVPHQQTAAKKTQTKNALHHYRNARSITSTYSIKKYFYTIDSFFEIEPVRVHTAHNIKKDDILVTVTILSTCSNTIRGIHLHVHLSTSLAKPFKAIEARGCESWVTNLSIIPHTLGILTANISYCVILLKYVNNSQVNMSIVLYLEKCPLPYPPTTPLPP